MISPNKLSSHVKELLQNNQILVCHISLFEIAIKQKIGKLSELTLPIDALIKQAISDNFSFLSISTSHIASYDAVPLAETHKDPFDRLIIATAIAENLPIISADEKFRLYNDLITLVEA
ncbi:type II toxin-antitoxin system VapC family toxin [Runella sp.]|uniref:type II toxin-antitoxin system VapC family toxin n=1 Tax=Runella sp. TaxID=1960881 RepID=UPI003D14C3EA